MITENKKAKVYEVNNNGEYGTFILMYQDKYLEVICNTSFGVYAHTWNSPGNNPFEFLINMPYGTFIYKMTEGKQMVLDNDGQETLMNELIEKLAEEKKWDENDVDYYKSLVCETIYNGTQTADEFRSHLVYSELYEELYDGEYENIEVVEEVNSQIQGLWNELWTPLIEKLKESVHNNVEQTETQ